MADDFNPANVQQYRSDWASQFQAPAGATPELVEAARVTHLARFDAALAADNVKLPTEAEKAAAAKAMAHGIAHAPDPRGYRFDLPHQLTGSLRTEKLVALDSEMRSWAAASAMDPSVANGLLSRIAEVGQEVAGLSDEAKASWHQERRQMMVGVLGGQDAYDKAVSDAKAALDIAQGDAAKFSRTLADSLALYDPHVLQALAHQGRQHRSWREAK